MENQNQFESYQRYQEYLKQPLTVGEWFIAILVTAIPLVGIIMLFVWAFGSNTNINKANWAKATLIWMAVGIVIAFFVFAIIEATFLSAFTNA